MKLGGPWLVSGAPFGTSLAPHSIYVCPLLDDTLHPRSMHPPCSSCFCQPRWNKVCGNTPENLMTTLVPDSTMFSFMGGGGGGARLGSVLGGAGPRTSGGFAGATGSTQMLVARGSPTTVAGRGSPQQSQRNQADSVSGMQHEISYAGFSQGMDSSGVFRLLWAIASGQRETETDACGVVLIIQLTAAHASCRWAWLPMPAALGLH